MKEMNDEELQRMFEEGHISSRKSLNEDEKAYSTLFEALNKELENGLPYYFAAKVTRNIQAQQKKNHELRSALIVAGLFLISMAILCGIITFVTPDTRSMMLEYKWVLLMIPIAFIVIQYFDQKLVKTKIFRGPNT
ncbi:MAG: hypothetical protein JSU01_21410 [Bacteroidetes bacterium]|nr:hypothetical protein [Bacteroidota bacterium]